MMKFQKMNFFWKAPSGTIDMFSSKDLLSILYSIKSILIWKNNKTFFLNIKKVIWKQKQVHYLWNTLYLVQKITTFSRTGSNIKTELTFETSSEKREPIMFIMFMIRNSSSGKIFPKISLRNLAKPNFLELFFLLSSF